MNKHCIRMSIVALAAGAFSLIPVTGSAQALAASGSTTVSSSTSVNVGTSTTLSTSVTVSPTDSTWD